MGFSSLIKEDPEGPFAPSVVQVTMKSQLL